MFQPSIHPILEFWQLFNLGTISDIEKKQLKKLEPTPAIPMEQLRAQISSFRHIETKTDQSWIYYVGGGSGLVYYYYL